MLSYNCRYLDVICTLNLKHFVDIAKDTYESTMLLEGSVCSYKKDTFVDLYICVVDGKFVTGIHHKVDDFNFEVINYPFPKSNINSMLSYSTFYLHLIRYLDFVMTSMISCFGQNLTILNWSNVPTCMASCLNISKILFDLQNI